VTASCVYEGVVRHRRHAPVRHALEHRIALLYLDLDELPGLFDGHALWSARRPALAWFRRADHLGDPREPLEQAVRDLVEERSGSRPDGPIRLLTQARYLGHCFNPVSFYYCFDAAGERVRAVVAEVTNTPWGERHAYVLAGDLEQRVPKALHVSPFLGMDHHYDWRVMEPGERLIVHVGVGDVFDATLTLRRRAFGHAALRRVLVRHPAATMVVAARIYAHALALRLKGAPVHAHPGRAA